MTKIAYKLVKNVLVLKALFLGRFIRDNNLVVVVSAHNNFTGNCKYAVMAIQEKFPQKKIIWFVDNLSEEKTLQSEAVVRTGIRLTTKYFTAISKAKYVITDGNFMGGWIANGATQIDFWHGIPIKKIKYDVLAKEPSFLRIFLWWCNRNTFIQSGSSDFVSEILCKSGRLPLAMKHTLGAPCIAPLVDEDIFKKEIFKDKKLKQLFLDKNMFAKVYLYAPTFRDSGVKFLENLNFDIEKIQKVCAEMNVLFLIKMHPWCSLHLGKEYPNIKILNKNYDAGLVIAMSDVVISDYSSMFHNGLVAGKDLLLMHGDIKEYRKNNRDIYDWSLDDLQGDIITDFKDLYEIIKKNSAIKPVPNHIVNKYWEKSIVDNPYKFLEVLK